MRVLVVGAGGVGSAIATAIGDADVLEHVVVADVDEERAAHAIAGLDERRFTAHAIDASAAAVVEALARGERIDIVLNACDPRFNPPIFAAAFAADCHYLDMAMNLSEPHPEHPDELPGRALGADQL